MGHWWNDTYRCRCWIHIPEDFRANVCCIYSHRNRSWSCVSPLNFNHKSTKIKLLKFLLYFDLQPEENLYDHLNFKLWGLHLRICILGKFVIFYYITCFEMRGFLHIISITG